MGNTPARKSLGISPAGLVVFGIATEGSGRRSGSGGGLVEESKGKERSRGEERGNADVSSLSGQRKMSSRPPPRQQELLFTHLARSVSICLATPVLLIVLAEEI